MAKIFNGVVVSTKTLKTIVVKVISQRVHPLYHKTLSRSKKYKVHSENNEVKVGDTITFVESKPISKDKRFKFLKIMKSARV